MGFFRDIRLMTLLLWLMILVLLGMLGFAFYQGYRIHQYTVTNVFNYGVFVDDIHLGGMTRYEAEEVIVKNYRLFIGQVMVTLEFDDETVIVNDLDIMPSERIQQTLDEAYRIGREGTPTENLAVIQRLPHEPIYLYTSKEYRYDALEERLIELLEEKTVPPRNARVVGFDPHAQKPEHRFTFSYEEAGKTYRMNHLLKRVTNEIENRSYGVIPVDYDDIAPAITVEDLKKHNTKIDTSTTELTQDTDRNHNILLACESISGFALGSDEVFDLNKLVGERTKSRGFERALNAEFMLSRNTGIGQVASTLYQAALKSDMRIMERHANLHVMDYTEVGMDALVDENHNLVFKNPHDTPVYVIMWADDVQGILAAEIYGAPLKDGVHISIEVETDMDVEPSGEIQIIPTLYLEQGQTKSVAALSGAECRSYRVYKDKDDKVLERQLLYEDYYEPLQGRIYYHQNDPPPTT